METRTSYILVGAFLIAAVAGLIGFIIWTVKSDADTQYAVYRSYFPGSVSGLNETSEVRYRGIPIGQVTDIRIDPDNVERIRVTMKIVASTPIKEDSIASVEQQGITGVAYIQISGGSQASPVLEKKGEQKFPVIVAKRSQLEALFSDTPELIARIMKLTDRVALLFDDRNIITISETLTNLQNLTATLADSSQKIAELIDDTAAFAGDLRMAGKEIDGLMKDARGAVGQVGTIVNDVSGLVKDTRGSLTRIETGATSVLATAQSSLKTVDGEIVSISGEAKAMLREFNETAQSLGATSEALNAIVTENRKPLHDFMGEGLYDFAQLVVEMRGLVASLSRIADRLETDPSLFLFGGSEKGFEAK